MAYVVLCKEPEVEELAYVLPNASTDAAAVMLLMQSRAEEFIDEAVSLDAEDGEPIGEYTITSNAEALTVSVAEAIGTKSVDRITMSASWVEIDV